MRATATIEVNRPIGDVFAYVADATNMNHWVTGVRRMERVSEHDGVGARYTSLYDYRGETYEMAYEVTDYDSPTRFGFRATEGEFPFHGVLTLTETADGTAVTNSINAPADSRTTAVIYWFTGPVLRYFVRRRLAGELDDLAHLLESSDPADRTGGAPTEAPV